MNAYGKYIGSGEAAEPLDDNHAIIQRRDCYRFGSDAVALAHFAAKYVRRDERVFDLCSGCGIVGIQIAIETGASVVGAELDKTLCDMSVRSAVMNGLTAVEFFNADVRDGESEPFASGRGKFDAVVCNPPFYKAGSIPRAVYPQAASELTVTFGDVADRAGLLLKQGGEFFVVHTSSRLDEVLSACRERGLMPKNMTINESGKTFLVRAVNGGKAGMTVVVMKF